MKKLLFFLPLLVISCGEPQNEDVVQTVNKEGSIEVEVTTKRQNGYDLMTTCQRVWVKNQLIKTIYHVDTLPSLGFTSQYGTNSSGEDTLVTLPCDYEFFITVK